LASSRDNHQRSLLIVLFKSAAVRDMIGKSRL
jgi:hypothetical protein